ncbi:MAG TPA: hypothetical protein VEG43_03985 [Dehalococcoidia bacterium]|nr:hypothetical protein [Dehalococcoidia bacterium]
MHKRKILLIGILIVAMLVTMGFTGCSSEQLMALQGIIQNADTLSGTITVKMKDGSIQTFNFSDVKAQPVIAALGGLSLEPGDPVIIKQDKNGKVQEVVGNFSEVDGIINGLGTHSVNITAEQGANITLEITPETVIRIEDGGVVNSTALQVGQQVQAKYDVTNLKALRIEIQDHEQQGNHQGEGEHAAKGKIEGAIAAIDTGSGNVTITTQEKGDITVHVTSNTTIRFEDKGTGVFADLQLGLQVQAEYDVSSMDALRIQVHDGKDEGDNGDRQQGNGD